MPKTEPKARANTHDSPATRMRMTVEGTVHPERLLAARLVIFGIPRAEAERRAKQAFAAKQADKLNGGSKR